MNQPSAPTSAAGVSATPPVQSNPGPVETVQDKVGVLADQAQHTAGEVTEQAKQQATSQLETQKDRAVDTLVTITQALRQTGQHLHQQEQKAVAGYVEQAAERVEGLTNHLRAHDVPALLNETEALARSKPALFIGSALALGFIGARFLMSSGQRARMQRSSGSTAAYSGPTPPGSASLQRSGSMYGRFEPVSLSAADAPDRGPDISEH